MLRWRLLLGTLLIAAMIGLCWLDFYANTPGVWLFPIAVIAAVLGTQEVLSLAAFAELRPLRWTVYCGNLLLVISCWGNPLANKIERWVHPIQTKIGAFDYVATNSTILNEGPMSEPAFVGLGIAALLVFLGELFRYKKPGGNMANLATGLLAIVYVGLMLSFAIQLRLYWGIGALAAWILVVKMGDIGAYTVGRLIGRHKMAPLISPGKTVEGAFGALAFSCLGSWLAFKCLVPLVAASPIDSETSSGWIAYGLLVGSAGLLGDLAESMLKRDVGRKDSSTWLPGFGGVLDILDSLLLSAPVAWACCAFGLVRF